MFWWTESAYSDWKWTDISLQCLNVSTQWCLFAVLSAVVDLLGGDVHLCAQLMIVLCVCVSDRTGAALWCYRGCDQRDPDRVHHARASSGGFAAGAEDPRAGLWGWVHSDLLTFIGAWLVSPLTKNNNLIYNVIVTNHLWGNNFAVLYHICFIFKLQWRM